MPGRVLVAGHSSTTLPRLRQPLVFLHSTPNMKTVTSVALCSAALFVTSIGYSSDVANTNTSPAPEPAIKVGTGFDFSSGSYGLSQRTDVLSVPVNLSVEQERWIVRATFPYISIKGPATVIAGVEPVAVPQRPVNRQESGFGDATLSGTFHANPTPGELNVDLTGRVKFGTADKDKGLGTGETDFYAQADFYKAIGNVIPFVTMGYRFLGSNATYPLKDGYYFSAGSSFRVSPTVVVGAAYDWRSRIVAGAANGSDALVFASANVTPQWNLLGYLLGGFNNASPDYGVGGAITYKF